MSTRDALIEEIMKQPEPVLREMRHYLDLIIARQEPTPNGKPGVGLGWPEGYFERTAGSFAHEPLERPPQPPLEKRQEW